MENKKYSFSIQYSHEDEGFIATCPEFPGLSAFGESEEEALSEARIALEGFIETYVENGKPLPDPFIIREFSGQLRLRLPKSLHGSLSFRAEIEGVSLNTLLIHCIQEGFTKKIISDEIREIINEGFTKTENMIKMATKTEISVTDDIENKLLPIDSYGIHLGEKNEPLEFEA